LPEGLSGEVLRPGDGGYEEARRVHNGLVDKRPSWSSAAGRCRKLLGLSILAVARVWRSRYAAAATTSPAWASATRQTEAAQSRSATAIRSLIGDEATGAWTLGGRRGLFLSPLPTTKGADQQALREALW